jgi:hypothetical protein
MVLFFIFIPSIVIEPSPVAGSVYDGSRGSDSRNFLLTTAVEGLVSMLGEKEEVRPHSYGNSHSGFEAFLKDVH